MLKKIYCILFILATCSLLFTSMAFAAATGAALSETELQADLSKMYGDKYDAPISQRTLDESKVKIEDGALEIRTTDLYLPGKNGLDFKLIRYYNNHEGYIQKSQQPAYWYYNPADNKRYLIKFKSEQQMADNAFEDFKLDFFNASSFTTYEGFKVYRFNYDDVGATLKRDKTISPVYLETPTTKETEEINKNRVIRLDGGKYHLNTGFKLCMPSYRRVQTLISTEYKYVFENGEGEVFSISESKTGSWTDTYWAGSSSPGYRYRVRYVNKDDRTIRAEHTEGFTYNRQIFDLDGKTYYFDGEDFKGISDRYGNTIVYNIDNQTGKVTIRDTYNRTITIENIVSTDENATTLVTVNANGNTKKIKYEVLRTKSETNPDLYKIYDNKYTLKVSVQEETDVSIENTKNITTYDITKKESLSTNVLDTHYILHCYATSNVDSISYPTSYQKNFTYTAMDKIYDYTNSGNYTQWYVETVSDNEKNNTISYSYSRNRKSLGYLGSYELVNEQTTITNSSNNTSEEHTVSDNKIVKTVVKDESGNTIKDEDYVYTKSRLTKLIRNLKNGSNSLSIEKEWAYDKNGDVTSEISGDMIISYIYTTPTYGFTSMDAYKFLETKTVRTKKNVNQTSGAVTYDTVKEKYTYTKDTNRSLLMKEILENNSTIPKAKSEFTYNSDGTINTQKDWIDDTDFAYTEYGYTTSEYGGPQITATANNIKDANGFSKPDISVISKYDEWGNLAEHVDGNGNPYYNEYDLLNRVKLERDPLKNEIKYFYDLDDNNIITKDKNGLETKYQYTKAGMTDYVAVKKNNDWIDVARFTYDDFYRLETETGYNDETQSRPIITTYGYDSLGRRNSQSTVQDGKTYNSYTFDYIELENIADKQSAVIKKPTDINFAKVKEYYDLQTGNKVRTTAISQKNEAELYNAKFEYDLVGNLLKTQEGSLYGTNKYTAQYEYDFAGNPVKETNALGNFTSKTYDMLGRVTSFTDSGLNVTNYTYDVLGRNIKTISPFEDSHTTEKLNYYDNNGNVVMEKQQDNLPGAKRTDKVTEYKYNDNNNLIQVKQQKDIASYVYTIYEYNAMGSATAIATGATQDTTKISDVANDPAVSVERYDYNDLNQLERVTDALNQATELRTDFFGNMVSKTDRNGTKIDYEYNVYGNIIEEIASIDDKTEQNTFEYDGYGNLKEMRNTSNKTEYEYNELSLLETETIGKTVKTYLYNPSGSRSSFTLTNNGKTELNLSYSYYDNQQLRYVYKSGSQIGSYTYYNNGNLKKSTIGSTYVTDYTYNEANLIKTLTNKKSTKTLSSYEYEYYLGGNQREKQDSENGTTSYEYDKLGQLTKEIAPDGTSTYEYDTRNNRISMQKPGTSISYTYDKNNRLITENETIFPERPTQRYWYDGNGNMLSKTNFLLAYGGGEESIGLLQVGADKTGIEYYTYDLFNRQTSAVTDKYTASYTYDASGLRMSKEVNGVKTNHIWDGSNMVAESDSDGIINAKYYRGLQLIASEKASVNSYYLYNAHGDVTQLTNSSNNDIINYSYDAFGVQKNIDDNNNDSNPFRYCGEYQDSSSGLIYLRARYYSPGTGRFTTEDPYWNTHNMIYGDNPDKHNPVPDMLSIMSSSNLYVYCLNNPIRYTDPLGLAPGDEFETLDKAALDFCLYFNNSSINDNKEYGGYIYAVERDGKVYYKYDGSFTGDEGTVKFEWDTITINGQSFNVIKGTTKLLSGFVHTHGGYDPKYKSDELSPEDKQAAKSAKVPIYVGTPKGLFIKYNPNTGNTWQGANNLPHDRNHPDLKGWFWFFYTWTWDHAKCEKCAN